MAGPLTSFTDRLTPSVPIEITFGAQPIATGKKVTTLFGHKAASGGTGADYLAHDVLNVGDPSLAKTEVDALAGTGSQIGKMAAAFVLANTAAGRANLPAFRVVLIPNGVSTFGSASEALNAVKFKRSDMLVSCYPASDSSNKTTLLNFTAMISGPDRDLSGQFGSFATFGSLDALATAEAFEFNNREAIIAYLQDTNTATVTPTVDTVISSKILINVSSTAGVYPGAIVTATGVPSGAKVVSVDGVSITLDQAATASHTAESTSIVNQVSQPVEILAAAHAAAMMSSAFPYNPLQGVTIGGLLPPQKTADWIAVDPNGDSEAALTAGLSPLYIQAGNTVGFIRSRTTFNLLSDNVSPATAYFDWQDLVVMNDFKEDCFLITQGPPFNNNPGGTKASATIAALLKDEILRQAQFFEDNNAFQGVQALAPLFLVQPSQTSRGRFDFQIPVNVLPGLFVIAGNIQGVSDIGNFSL